MSARKKPAPIKPRPSPKTVAARPTHKPNNVGTAAAVDGVTARELYGICRKLKLAQSCVRVVEVALRDQNCELDSNAADILAAHVTDAMHIQIMKIDRLLGRDVNEDDIEEGDL